MVTDTKAALLDTAERAARARGIDGFSYADLAAAVGIRKASIHYHFPTKAALSVALMRRYCDTFETACADISSEHPTGRAQLTAMIDHYRAALDGGTSLCLCVSFSTSRESLPPEVITQLSRFRTTMIRWLAMVFNLGQSDGTIPSVADPKAEATATLALLEGAQLAARAEENPDRFDTAVQILRRR